MSNSLLVLYTMEGCPFCIMMKDQLTESGIPFIERDVSKYEKEYDMFVEVAGNDMLPAFMIIKVSRKGNDVSLFAPERDFMEIKEGVEIIKEHFRK